MDRLWAPWRLDYVAAPKQGAADAPTALSHALLPGADRDCFLCRAAVTNAPREDLVVYRDQHVLTVLNRYPYNNGHLLIAPRAHTGQLPELTADQQLQLIQVIGKMTQLLEQRMRPDGFNVGLNLGRVAGAGVPGHLHWHVVPRWGGDTNFMPTLAGTRVIPQSLESAWELLTGARSESA
ncbi:MAG: HIT family hydrolase [Planctomycetes bacterium RBG_16_64_10]|nr:MAG: HIT family hydrolase [Planctomycetes bacterium RBG_16_64_10]